jgi:molybdopterin-guanine dinucleotide biosynthesis protein A
MGRDKAWMEHAGTPLIQLALAKARQLGVEDIYISGRADADYAALKYPVLFDLQPGFGPMGGIERGLWACATPLLLVLAVDLPQMTTEFLQKLSARCDRLTGAVPKLKGKFEPLAAIYPKRCHAFALDAIARSRLAAQDFVDVCRQEHAVRDYPVLDADTVCFANWNTPADVGGGPSV